MIGRAATYTWITEWLSVVSSVLLLLLAVVGVLLIGARLAIWTMRLIRSGWFFAWISCWIVIAESIARIVSFLHWHPMWSLRFFSWWFGIPMSNPHQPPPVAPVLDEVSEGRS